MKKVLFSLLLCTVITKSYGMNDNNRQLLAATQWGKIQHVKNALSQADVNTRDEQGRTPLHVASMRGAEDIVTFLLDHGANINSKDVYGYTALHMTGLYPDLTKLLVSRGADVNAQDNNGNTPLHAAAMYANTDRAKLLLALGADVNRVNRTGKTAYHYATLKEKF